MVQGALGRHDLCQRHVRRQQAVSNDDRTCQLYRIIIRNSALNQIVACYMLNKEPSCREKKQRGAVYYLENVTYMSIQPHKFSNCHFIKL